MSETTHKLYSNKVLYIPDFILPQDIPKVYHYFEYFNIAKLKDVKVLDHPEPEYNCEDRAYYGYAIIEVDIWYVNNASNAFYKSIMENSCKIVYNDPFYWDLEFYEGEDVDNYENNEENKKVVIKIEEYSIPSPPPISLNMDDAEHEEHNDYKEHAEHNDYDDTCSQDSFESLEENDDPEDVDYEFTDSENEDDLSFEYYIKFDKKREIKYNKNASRKRKFNVEIEALKKENNELKELLIKRNKNYLKNNKRKPEKNVWSRRLRAKIGC